MAHRLSLPARRSWQPQTVPLLARTALTDGIVEAIVPMGNRFCVVTPPGLSASGTAAFPFNDTGTPGVDFAARFGRGREMTTSSIYSLRDSCPAPLNATSAFNKEWSFLCIAEKISAAATSFSVGYGNTGSGTPILGFGESSSAGNWTMYSRGASDGGASERWNTSTAWSVGVPILAVGTRSEVRGIEQGWQDGLLKISQAPNTQTNMSVNTTTFGGIKRTGAVELKQQATIYLWVIWSRSLFPGEIQALSANPWQLFEFPSRPLIINSSAGGAVNTNVTLSPASFSYSPASITPKTNRLVTLTGPSFTYSPNSLTQVTTRKASLSAVSYSWSVQSLAAQTTRNATLSLAAFTYAPNDLTTQLTRKATLSPVSWSWTINDLTAVFVGSVAYAVTLSPVAFTFSPAYLEALNIILGGSLPTGHGKRKKLPYGWWEDREPEEIERAIERAEDAVETAQEAITAPRQERRDAQAELNAALAQINLDANIERLATLQAKQAKARLETIAKEVAQQRRDFERMRAEFEEEKKRRALLARLRDEDDALAVLLS